MMTLKVGGLEALLPEELERQLMLNPTRLSTYETARPEVVTYTEARTGLRIRDTQPSRAVGGSTPDRTGAQCRL